MSFRRYDLFLFEVEYIETHAATVCTVSCGIKLVNQKKKEDPCSYLIPLLLRLLLTKSPSQHLQTTQAQTHLEFLNAF